MQKNVISLLLAGIVGLSVYSCQKSSDIVTDQTFETLSAASNKKSAIELNGNSEILVVFKKGTQKNKKTVLFSKTGAKLKESVKTNAMMADGETEEINVLQTSKSLDQAIVEFKNNPDVAYVEPNQIYRPTETNDTYFVNGSMWGVSQNNEFGTQAAKLWDAGQKGSSNVYVGVIDQGIDVSHEDLRDNIGVNPFEIPNNGVDDDRNGYVDDVNGWDFINNDNTVYDEGGDVHGTVVAGVIGAKGGNGIGVAGMSWNVKILSGKFMGPNGGSTADAVKAIDYFIDLKKKGLNIVAINNSWAGAYSSILEDAIKRANKANILFIAAAGNSATDNDVWALFPANYPVDNVISVAALKSTGELASFSNYGAKKVHIAAPGEGIISTSPGNAYRSASGTSFAAPHITGAIAIYASLNTSASARQIKSAILETAGVPTQSLIGKVSNSRRVNVTRFASSGTTTKGKPGKRK